MIKYYCSNGERISEATIRKRYAEAKREYYTENPARQCEGCGATGVKLNPDHTISQKRLKDLHLADKIYDPRFWVTNCQERCHKEWESYGDGKLFHHNNFKDRMSLVALYDRETYIKRLFAIKENHPNFAEQIDEMINAIAL